jgi:hypothetical protein
MSSLAAQTGCCESSRAAVCDLRVKSDRVGAGLTAEVEAAHLLR